LKNKLTSGCNRVFPHLLIEEGKNGQDKEEILKELDAIRGEIRKLSHNEEYQMITTGELNEFTISLLELKPGSIDVIL